MTARADVKLNPPIMLSERGEGAPETMIVTGIASAADVLHYADGDDEVTDGARSDTAAQLRGVPLVSPEEHQRWLEATTRGETYEVTPLGTVIEADQDESGAVRFAAAVHGSEPVQRVRSGRWPAVSVGYVARYGGSTRADRAQKGRTINHLALVPRGRDPMARIRADGEDMPTIEEIKAAIAEMLTPMIAQIDGMHKAMADMKPPMKPEPPADEMKELAAKADAATARADAAEAKLSAIELEGRKARAGQLKAKIEALGIQTTADFARADAADLTLAERAIADHVLASTPRADGWGDPKPADPAKPRPSLSL